MLVTVLRHAESMSNAGLSSDTDPLLSPRGMEQARRTAERLGPEGVTHIWSSPFRRAIVTAGFVAARAGLKVRLEPGMCEHYIYESFRDYAPRALGDLAREFDFVRLPRGADSRPWTPEFPEPWEELLVRTAKVAKKALALARRSRTPDQVHLVVFGHGASVKALLRSLTGLDIAQSEPYVNAGLSRVRVMKSLPGKVVFLNDVAHLDGS